MKYAALNPRKSVMLSHQFLDGKVGKPCGIVPNDWDGGYVSVQKIGDTLLTITIDGNMKENEND